MKDDYKVVDRPKPRARFTNGDQNTLMAALRQTAETGKAIKCPIPNNKFGSRSTYLRLQGYRLRTQKIDAESCYAWCERLVPENGHAE